MTVNLTANFFANARGITFEDTASVTWAFNANTNEIEATSSGGGGGSGTVTSVGLADTSTTPIFVVSNTPVTVSGTIDITLGTQTAKTFFAGPTSGGAAQPAFRSIAAADVPTLNQSTTGNAATASAVAWAGVTGTPTTLTGYGITSPLPVAQGGTGETTAITAFENLSPMTTTGDIIYAPGAGTATRLGIGTTGQVLTVAGGIPSWATSSAAPTGANPSATIGLAAVNGSAATFMTSDSAPPLSQAIAPTWTGAHTFSSTITAQGSGNDSGLIFTGASGYINASGSTGLTIAATHALTMSAASYNFEIGGTGIWSMDASGGTTQQAASGETSQVVYGAANHYVQQLVGNGTNNESYGSLVQAGTSSSDWNTRWESYATGVLGTLYGDGGLVLGAPTGGDQGLGTLNATGLYVNGTAVLTALPSIANNEVVGNISGSSAAPVGLTQAQLTALVNQATASVSGAVPAYPNNTTTYLRGDLTWQTLPSGVAGGNPTATIGLSVVDGSATTFLRSDGAPALSQGIAPTWTGEHIFTPSGSNPAILVNCAANEYGLEIKGNSTSAESFGLLVEAATTSADICVQFTNQAGAVTFFEIFGDGHGTLGASATAGIQWTSAGAITSNIGTTLTTAALIGAAATDTVGFYGKTPAAQTASNSSMVTSNVASASVSVSTAYASAEINSIMTNVSRNAAILQEVMNVLFAIGIYATH